MGTLPVIADTFRCTIDWSLTSGIIAHNVLHFHAPGKSEAQVFAAFETNWHANMFEALPITTAITQFDVLKLDGTSATQSFAPTLANEHGSSSGTIIPEACAVVSLHTAVRGSRGRGRVFVGPITEVVQDNGLIVSPYVSEMNTAWGLFVAGMSVSACPLVIASYVHSDQNLVLSLHTDPGIGTQRRRLLQQRH